MTDYNGWTNYPTWCVNLWLSNDQGSSQYWDDAAREAESVADLANRLESEISEIANEYMPDIGMFADLFGWSLKMVNWDEIARHIWDNREDAA